MRVSRELGALTVDSGLACDTFNFICGARLKPAEVTARVGSLCKFFGPRPFSWWVGPGDTPEDLGEALVAAGLNRSDSEVAMGARLDALHLGAPVPDGLSITRVQSSAQLRDFASVVACNWNPPDPNVRAFYEQAATLLLRPECPLWLYVGYLNGRAVATAELTVSAGAVGLYNIATLQEYRGRGAGTALTTVPLRDALARGHQLAVLQAAPDGLRIYERIGFQAFGTITEYKP